MALPLLCSSPLGTPFNVPDVPLVAPSTSTPTVPDSSDVPDVPKAVLDAHNPKPSLTPTISVPDVPKAVPDAHNLCVPDTLLNPPLHPSDVVAPAPGTTNEVRPNDHLLFDASSNEPLTAPVSLNPFGISHLLQHYPDQHFTNTLVSIASSGARLGYEGSQNRRTLRPNHHSAFIQADTIAKSIQSEIDKGRIKEIPALPNDHYFCSPIGLVPKMTDGVQTGWRLIFDLSSPQARSVNDGIPPHYGSIVYETLNDAIKLVAKAGRGAVLMKRDLKSAFRHIPVSSCDHWLLIFEWQGKYYVDMFLPFGLRTAPRIFNLFSEALHWVFQTLYKWNLSHYLDDFLFIFPPGTDVSHHSKTFDSVLSTVGLSKAPEKDANGCVVTHLGFEFDSINMEVRLPVNKKLRAFRAVLHLSNASSVSLASLEEVLGFLSHCCQVVPLGRPFLRRLFSLLRRNETRHRFLRTRIPSSAKKDLQWWLYFLSSWSSVSIIRLSRVNHDVATDASGVKGIGGVYNRCVFSDRVPARHRKKHINWKEMFAVLHAFLIWHKVWAGGRLRLASDSSTVVQALHKKSIKGDTISPLQTILLIAAVFDIEILVFWIPSEENIVADAASRHDYKKLADLGFQVSALRNRTQDSKMSTLRQKLFSFLKNRSPLQHGNPTTPHVPPTPPSAASTVTNHSLPQSSPLHTGFLKSCAKSNRRQLKVTSPPCDPATSNLATTLKPSTMIESILSSEAATDSMGNDKKRLRLPITAPILHRIIDKIRNPDHDSINLKAALCVAFAGFLRSGEFTWDTTSGVYLARHHVVFNSNNSVTLTLPSSKTDPFHRGVSIILAGSPSSPICPVRSLRALFTRFPRNSSHPLFSRTSGPFNRQYLVEKIKEMLLRAAISTVGFSGHSLRKGAAVSAAANGLSRDEIKLLGRWKSDAVDVYINEVSEVDRLRNLLQLNSKLHNFPPPTISSLASAM
jgi:hypothetical protein